MKTLKLSSARDVPSLTTEADILSAGFKLDENGMVALTKENSQKAYDCICMNPKYKAAHMEYYEKLGEKSLASYSLSEWQEMIRIIAASNSTRSAKKNTKSMGKYIFNNKDAFLEKLKSGEFSLVDNLAFGKDYTRHENSLASKGCSYLCRLEYKKALFPINDKVIRTMLPYYLGYYEVANVQTSDLDRMSYVELAELLKKLKTKAGGSLTYYDIDQIIWWCYRNDPVRQTVANVLAKKTSLKK